MKSLVKQECLWCGKETSRPDDEDIDFLDFGLCRDCQYQVRAQKGISLEDYLNGIEAPVLLIDNQKKIAMTNLACQVLLCKMNHQMQGRLGGDVFECEYARLPGGCGQTIHCSACAIRRTVEETASTGKSLRNVPATLRQSRPGDIKEIRLRISTEMTENGVLLQIDEVSPA